MSTIHNPSQINPADYEWVQGNEGVHYYWNGGSTCSHCGHFIRWAIRYTHKPSGQRVEFGEICASQIDVADDRATYEMNKLRKLVANQRKAIAAKKQVEEKREHFLRHYQDVAEYVEEMQERGDSFEFMQDMARTYDQWSYLTDRQADAVRRIKKGREDWVKRQAEKPQPVTQAPEGSARVSGEIVSTKWQENDFGGALKMLVVLDDLNKVWGTVPKNVMAEVNNRDENPGEYKGTGVEFTATFTRSKDDEHFSFFKRPTKAVTV
jgi:hypothetical protein